MTMTSSTTARLPDTEGDEDLVYVYGLEGHALEEA